MSVQIHVVDASGIEGANQSIAAYGGGQHSALTWGRRLRSSPLSSPARREGELAGAKRILRLNSEACGPRFSRGFARVVFLALTMVDFP